MRGCVPAGSVGGVPCGLCGTVLLPLPKLGRSRVLKTKRWARVLVVAMTLAPVSLWLGARSGPALGARGSAAGRDSGQNQTTWTLGGVLKQLDAGAREVYSMTGCLELTQVTVGVCDRAPETGQIP